MMSQRHSAAKSNSFSLEDSILLYLNGETFSHVKIRLRLWMCQRPVAFMAIDRLDDARNPRLNRFINSYRWTQIESNVDGNGVVTFQ